MSGSQLLPDDFAGSVRLFPLPDLVMFPHVVQTLRVHEPRYIALLEDATQGDQLITTALLRPGWEADYEGEPPIYSTVCIGRVVSHSRQADGCYNLLLSGVARGRVCRELEMRDLYRRAEVEVLADDEVFSADSTPSDLRDRLLDAFWQLNPQGLLSEPSIHLLLKDQVALGTLTDVIAFATPLRLADKHRLLAEPSVDRRVQILVDRLQSLTTIDAATRPTTFPPDFSSN